MKKLSRQAKVAIGVCIATLFTTGRGHSIDSATTAPDGGEFYQQSLDCIGLEIHASSKVQPASLQEAAYLVRKMIGHRPDIGSALGRLGVRLAIMAPTEMTTDLPEHADLTPATYWNRRARGMGPTAERPVVSCGEENLLGIRGDPYAAENILIHEFAHAIHYAVRQLDATFQSRLEDCFDQAKKQKHWTGTYAMENPSEYWAEGSQSWFACNRINDAEHGSVNSRDALREYDPPLATLLTEIYGADPSPYQRPSARSAADRAHLANLDPASLPAFRWPEHAPDAAEFGEPLVWIPAEDLPPASPRSAAAPVHLVMMNHSKEAVRINWIGFDGERAMPIELRPQESIPMSTFAGHAWVVSDGERELGGFTAGNRDGRLVVEESHLSQ